LSEAVQRILTAHELGHDRLHQAIAMLKGFQEIVAVWVAPFLRKSLYLSRKVDTTM